MPVTVKDLLDVPLLELRLVAGEAGADRAIRWAHTSELSDPTRWLSGGELLLTTGMGAAGPPAAQRDYVERLVDAALVGLGFGIGLGFDEVPVPLLEAAEGAGFPVLEVPYPVPFIAITEAIASRLAEDRTRELQTSVDVHDRLASLVVRGAGPADVLDEVVELARGWALLFDLRGDVLARASASRQHPPEPAEVWAALPPGLAAGTKPVTASETGPRGSRIALGVTAGPRSEGVLVFGKSSRLEQTDRLVVRHAVTVLGLLLASRRGVIEAERRIAGDVLSEAFAGRLGGRDLIRRLELAGFPAGAPLTALVVEAGVEDGDLDGFAWAVDAALGTRTGAVRATSLGGRVVALVDHESPEELAAALQSELVAGDGGAGGPAARVGVGERVEPGEVRHSYLSALFALRGAPPGRAIASPRDLGSYGFLLGGQPRPALEGFVRSVLGPLIEHDRARSSDLVRSAREFIAAGGRWEQGAAVLGVHRHTLRYRVRQAEDLLGRDLASAEDRLELWLALKAAEVLEE